MLRIAVIGAGGHSRGNHLSSLQRFVSERPGVVELAALCDLREDVARDMARQYGFARTYTDIDRMLEAETLDGLIAITPVAVTAEVVAHLVPTGIPLLMEKPPGATLEEAEAICRLVEQHEARVMVSMNRRFDPAVALACQRRADRVLESLDGVMFRHNRTEPEHIWSTGIHIVDAMRRIAGDVTDHSVDAWRVDGVLWYDIRFTYASGTRGTLHVRPTCGCLAESYDLFGPGYRILAHTGEHGPGTVTCWEGGQAAETTEPAKDMPRFVRNGAYDETAAFIAALEQDRAPWPAPADVLQSVQLCRRIHEQVCEQGV